MLIPEDLDLELDQFVERFEIARAQDPHIDVDYFMPSHDHPRYAAIGCELLRVDMELSAAIGQLISIDSYRRRFPTICDNPLHLRQLTAEASRVAQEVQPPAKQAPSKTPTEQTINAQPPTIGQALCGFRILAELGRGAFSWVYLATDASLSQRPVVLKLSSQFPGEAQLLSRLQHKNIVPIYSLHQWHQYHILCMPFLGAVTLADLLKSDRPASSKPLSGQALIDTLMTRASHTWKDDLPATSASLVQQINSTTDNGLSSQLQSEVSRMSTTELALWIVAELADGLAHAHMRGILHRDIKPANVLLSDDGLPMLLDFNLATESKPTSSAEHVVGGTLRYMAPEQLQAVQKKNPSHDARADIFSLGIVLYELLMRATPFPDRTGAIADVLQQMYLDRQSPPSIPTDWKRGLTPAVANIVARTLAPLPEDRYCSADQLRDELRRQLNAKPLVFTRDRSPRERLAKWNKRHPRLSSLTIATTLSLLLLTMAMASLWIARSRIEKLAALDWLHQVEQAEANARNLLACQNAPSAAIEKWLDDSAQTLRPSSTHRIHALNSSQHAQARSRLARIHFYRAQGSITLSSRTLEAQRQELLAQALQELNTSHELEPSEATQAWIDLVDRSAAADLDLAPSLARPLPQSIEHELQLAVDSVDRYAANPWHWLSVGQMHLFLGRLDAARSDFQLSHQLARQQQPLPAFFLGVVEMKRRNFAAAEAWFTDALHLDPQSSDALLSRAATRVELKKYQQAIADIDQLGQAIDKFPRAWFIRERAESRLGDATAAQHSLMTGLKLTPRDALGWNARGEARLRTKPPDPEGALADFEKAIQTDPDLRNAYENAAHVLAEHLARPTAAIDKLNQVLEREPDYALAYSSRAVLMARSGQTAEAEKDVEAALARDRSAIICYQAASALAILDKDKADSKKDLADSPPLSRSTIKPLDLLKEALRQDPKLNRLMQRDQDLLILHDSPEFRELLSAARKLQ